MILWPAVVLLAVAGCTSVQPSSAPPSPGETSDRSSVPRFDWFSYEGRDPVYEEAEANSNEYLNPILAGFYPDPSIARAGDDYYLVNSSFAYFPGVPLSHSTDLVHWKQIGHVLDRPGQFNLSGLRISQGVFAPTIRHHDGTFYMITTIVGGGGNVLVTTEDPKGRWSDPVPLDFDGIDPSIFFDDDGKVYITNNGPPPEEPRYDGHRALWIQEYDPEAQEMVGPRKVLVNGGVDLSKEPVWIEAPHIFKIDGTYYLIAAEGGTAENHSEVVFRSDSVWGPYEPYEGNPILTQRHLDPDRPRPITTAGHADFVQIPDGGWWAVFLGVRPYQGNHYNNGRETYLMPVEWTDDGWPVLTEGDETVPYVHERPDLPIAPVPDVPTSGNFTVRTDFENETLAPYWNLIRTPRETWYDVEASTLTIQPRTVPLSSKEDQPSFVGRRQQHARASASTALRYTPSAPGDKAGLAAFQNSNHYYLMTVTQRSGRRTLQLEMAAGERTNGTTRVIASTPLPSSRDEPLYLKIEAEGADYSFYYAYRPEEWKALKEGADGTVLSTKTAGGFVGTYFGLYAYSE